MCGRFARTSSRSVIRDEFGLAKSPAIDLSPRYNVCPGEAVLAVVGGPSGRTLTTLRWGFVPGFARDASTGPRAINARAETVAARPAFRDAFKRRRCLVIADGFYEWRREGASRHPYFVRLRTGRPMGFAGIWDRWVSQEGVALASCAIVTCEANEVLAPIHDRMPVIVPPPARDRWLDRELIDPVVARAILVPYPAEEMETYPVSRMINSPRNDSPDCIKRLDAPGET